MRRAQHPGVIPEEVSHMIRVATLSSLYLLSMGLLIAAYAMLPIVGR